MNRPTNTRSVAATEREKFWRRRLGRLRLGAEPLSDQLERHRRSTYALSVISAIVAAMFVALFSAFRAPITGLVMASVILGPIVILAWWDFRRMERGAAEFEAEIRASAAGEGGAK
jgi:hypothetical protein